MTGKGRSLAALALCLPLAALLGACGQAETTGTGVLTVEVSNLVGAQGSELGAEMTMKVDYMQRTPEWTFLTATVTGSPFSYTDTLEQLPEGEFTMLVRAGSDQGTEVAKVKGQGCEMTFQMGAGEKATIAIDGLNEFGDKGYGPCEATISR